MIFSVLVSFSVAARLALCTDLTCHLNRATIQQKFFRQRGLARIRVADDRKCPSPGDFRRQVGGVAGGLIQ